MLVLLADTFTITVTVTTITSPVVLLVSLHWLYWCSFPGRLLANNWPVRNCTITLFPSPYLELTELFGVWVWVTLRLRVSQSVCLRGLWPDISYCFVLGGHPLWRDGGSVFCQSVSAVISQLSVCTVIYILHVLHDMTLIKYIQGLGQSGLSTTDYAPFLVAFATTAV
jgi:hypothetical protein